MIPVRLDDCFRDAGIALTKAGREARLAPSVLIHNEDGAKLALREEITPQHWAKVLLDLPPGNFPEATLLWFVNWAPGDNDALWYSRGPFPGEDKSPWTILVNGHKITQRQSIARLLTGGWDRCTVPARFLKAGRNEIVFAGHGWLYLDSPPNRTAAACSRQGYTISDSDIVQAESPGGFGRSLRSFDGGKTWHPDAFGPGRDRSGEFLVRLRVKGHPVAGIITSEPIDLGDPDGAGRIAPVMEVRSCALEAKLETPRGTSIALEMRSGATPAFDPKSWSPWRRTARLARPGLARRSPHQPTIQSWRFSEGGRFVQWRAMLSSQRLDATPTLSNVALKADVKSEPAKSVYQIASHERPVLTRSSYAFQWMAPNPRAERLVKQYRLDEVIARGKTDLERLCVLRDWCQKQWFGWQRTDFPFCASWDPLEILDTVKNNWGYGMCTHWAALFTGCAGALGYHARTLIIDHHCLNEAWVDELGKWVIFDCSGDNNMLWELDGQPLNALEVHEAIRHGRSEELTLRVWRAFWQPRLPNAISGPKKVPGAFEYICKPLARSKDIYCRFGICLRNDHLVEPTPVEDRHGHDHYHWNGYLWWTDEEAPKYPEYSLLTRRAGDLYWTVGRVGVHLQETRRPGVLEARLEHAMPNFSHYQIKRGETWERTEETFEWPLATVEDRLEVRAVSAFQRPGPATVVEVIGK